MSRQLPARPNLEHLKNQAKDLLPELQRQDPALQLADALHAIAREYGFSTWAVLKAHVESLPRATAAAQENPFTGTWTANVAKSKRDPVNQFRRATLHFGVAGDTVTITDVVVDASGREQRGTNTIQADAQEHAVAHEYVLVARWRGSHILEAVTKKGDREVGRVTYAVSPDGATLTLSAASKAHDGYPAAEHASVFDRELGG